MATMGTMGDMGYVAVRTGAGEEGLVWFYAPLGLGVSAR
jgi:hypothetical protein